MSQSFENQPPEPAIPSSHYLPASVHFVSGSPKDPRYVQQLLGVQAMSEEDRLRMHEDAGCLDRTE